jgi:acylphosphatase
MEGSYFTRKKATSYGITGWVRNAPMGKVYPLCVNSWNILLTWHMDKVEGEAQGEDEKLQMLLKDLDRGPTHAHVVKLETQEIEVVDGESGFEVRT